MKAYGFTRNDVDTFEMQYAIMTAQLDAEKKAILALKQDKEGVPLVLSDRSAVDPIVYAGTSRAVGGMETSQRLLETREFQETLPFYQISLFSTSYTSHNSGSSAEMSLFS